MTQSELDKLETLNQSIIKKYLADIGRRGGARATDKQKAAVRLNGLKGGRPKGSKNKKSQKQLLPDSKVF